MFKEKSELTHLDLLSIPQEKSSKRLLVGGNIDCEDIILNDI